MIKVSIQNTITGQPYEGKFLTIDEANAWLSQGAEGKWWGEPEWTEVIPAVTEETQIQISEPIYDDQGNIVVPAQYSTTVTIIEPERTIVHPAEYTVVIEDITAQIEYEKDVAKNLARMEFGKRLMAELAASNQMDLVSGALTVPQIIEAEAALATIQRYISQGSLGLAAQLLQTTTIPHFGDAKKALFLNKMQEYLSNEL